MALARGRVEVVWVYGACERGEAGYVLDRGGLHHGGIVDTVGNEPHCRRGAGEPGSLYLVTLGIMRAMAQDALRGHVDLLLLSVLAHGPAHGYGLVEALRERSDGAFDLAEGTVYPALYRLERQGLVKSRWEDGQTRRRRVYRLTRSGSAELRRERDGWQRYVQAMQEVLA
jgi:transcriptional regulator